MKNEVYPESPCTRICRIDDHSGFCTGCYRTLDEIAAWSGLDEMDRVRIFRDLTRRRRQKPFSKGA